MPNLDATVWQVSSSLMLYHWPQSVFDVVTASVGTALSLKLGFIDLFIADRNNRGGSTLLKKKISYVSYGRRPGG